MYSNVCLTPLFQIKKEVSTQEDSAINIYEQVYRDDTSGTGNAVQEVFYEPMPGNPEEAKTFPIKELFYAYDASSTGNYDASGAGDYVEEPIKEPVCAYDASCKGNYDASGAGNYVEEPLKEPVYAYDSSGGGDIPGNPD